jgi:RND superfamily putative drug exporter
MLVQSRPRPLAAVSLLLMILVVIPVFGLRLDNSDAGNDPSNTSTYKAFNMLAQGFGPGFNGPLLIATELPRPLRPGASAIREAPALPAISEALRNAPDIVAVTPPQLSPSGRIAVIRAYPRSAPQDQATTDLVNHLRHDVLPPLGARYGVSALVGGFTAGSIDFSNVMSSKLPVFIAVVVVLSALLLLVIFRSLVIPLQAAVMNLLSIGGALGVTSLVFQKGWLAGVFGVSTGPVEPWIPVLMFAVVFGLSMDYEVFLISRVREEWVRGRNATSAVADGIAFTGRVITAAAAIMICVFLSFLLGDQRAVKEFGFGLAAAVFLDAVVIRCVMLPAVLELLGELTWKLPRWLDERLPRINIEGSALAGAGSSRRGVRDASPAEPEPVQS